jgi:hypothetical protein
MRPFFLAAAVSSLPGFSAVRAIVGSLCEGFVTTTTSGSLRGSALPLPVNELKAHLRKCRSVSLRQAQEAMLAQLNASGESQVSLTDPDARAMVTHQKTTVGYDAQVAGDAKHKLSTQLAFGVQIARIEAGHFFQFEKVRDLDRAAFERHQPRLSQVA